MGVFRVLLPRKVAAYTYHRNGTSTITDAPTIRTLDFVLQDELADWREGEMLLQSLISTPAEVERAAAGTPVVYYVFDLLHLDGFDLQRVPLSARLALLRRVLRPVEHLKHVESVRDDVAYVRFAKGCSAPDQQTKDEIMGVIMQRVPGLKGVEEVAPRRIVAHGA